MKIATLFTVILGVLSMSSSASNWTNYNQENSPIPSNSITAILNTETVNWIGTDNGLATFDGDSWDVFHSETSDLVDDRVYDLHQDANGNTWVVTAQGITRINEDGWEVRDITDIPESITQFRSIDSDADGNVWVGTWGHGLLKYDGSVWTQFHTENSNIPSNGIFEVKLDITGAVWVGTFNAGFATFDGQDWTIYNSSNSELPNNNVRCIEFDLSNNAWIGTDDGLLRKTPSDEWNVFTYLELGHSVHAVREVIRSETGNMWFATDGGLIKFENFVYTFYTAQNSNIIHNNLYCVNQDSRGDIWVGTGNDGTSVLSSNSSLSTYKHDIQAYFEPYPNPTINNLTLALTQPVKGQFEVTVFNNLGQVVLKQTENTFEGKRYELLTEKLPSGSYSVSVLYKGKTDTKRIIKL